MPSLWVDYAASWFRLWQGRESLRAYQLQRLRALLRHAMEHVPFYREKFGGAGFDAAGLRALDALQELPTTTKAELQTANFADRIDERLEPSDYRVHETSGSTGEPMRIARTPEEDLRLFGRRHRVQVRCGLRPWHRRVILGASPTITRVHRAGLFSVEGIDLEEGADGAIERLEEIRPDILKGPPSFLDLLVERHPERLGRLCPRVIFAGAEQLSPVLEARLKEVCGCPVVNFYGAVECNLIAWRCLDCGQYHTCDDSVIVEVLRDGRPVGPGEDGEVVVTALESYAMPFIRYRIGDWVRVPEEASQCRCAFGTLERIEGRAVDYLRFAQADPISPYTLMDQLDTISVIRRYECEQTSERGLRVQYQLALGAERACVEGTVRERCRGVIPDDVELAIEVVKEFRFDPSAKRRFIKGLPAQPAEVNETSAAVSV